MNLRAVALVGAWLAVALGPLGAYHRFLPPLVGFRVFGLGALLAAGVVGVGLVDALIRKSATGWRYVALGLPVLLLVGGALFRAPRGAPTLNDVATDLDDPPGLAGAEAYSESHRAVVRKAYPALKSLDMELAPPLVLARVAELAGAQSAWKVLQVDGQAFTVVGTAETALFHFVDDWVVRVRPQGTGSRVDMRSRSRVGRGDMGTNAGRIQTFLEALRSAPVSGR